jgi:two-component system chemotaxis response regulator CheB
MNRQSQRSLHHIEALVIGGSAGAVSSLAQVLPSLTPDFPWPIILVVHVPSGKQSGIANLFLSICRLSVKEAEDKEPLLAGTIYVAPPDYHLLVEVDRRLSLSDDPPVHHSRPSIDVLFQSAANAYGRNLLAILLTGANQDGAQGIQAICQAGGMAFVQRPQASQARVMPETALAAAPAAVPIDLDAIGRLLQHQTW